VRCWSRSSKPASSAARPRVGNGGVIDRRGPFPFPNKEKGNGTVARQPATPPRSEGPPGQASVGVEQARARMIVPPALLGLTRAACLAIDFPRAVAYRPSHLHLHLRIALARPGAV
jgi:hypothetical protein